MNILTTILILQKAIFSPFDPCTLEIEDGVLKESSWVTWSTLQHHPEEKKSHAENVLTLMQTAYETSEDPIAREKIARLAEDPRSWFHNIANPIPRKKWSFVIEDSQNLMQPSKVENAFKNPNETNAYSFWSEILGYLDGVFDFQEEIQFSAIRAPKDPVARSENVRIQWLGHSTTLLQAAGINLLFDPFFGDLTFYTRYTPPGISLENLPLIDTILFSHNQADHCDLEAVNTLKHFQPDIFTPVKMGSIFQKMGFKHVSDHSWWSTSETEGMRIHSVPTKHRSYQFGVQGADESLWTGWVIETKGQTIYFVGDTAYDPELFGQINEEFGPIDILLMPIGPEYQENMHVNLFQALEATRFFQPKKMIPIHWGVIRFGDEQIQDPIRQLEKYLQNEFSDLKDTVHILKIGDVLEIDTPTVIEDDHEDSIDRSERIHWDEAPPIID